MPETETLDKLFLELSQFSRAKTARELSLTKQADGYGRALLMIANGCADPQKFAKEQFEKFHVNRESK